MAKLPSTGKQNHLSTSSASGSVTGGASGCPNFGICGGCSWSHLSLQEQQTMKIQELTQALVALFPLGFPEVQYHSLLNLESSDGLALRSRFDFVIERSGADLAVLKMGLHGLDHQLLDIKECRLLEPSLQKAYEIFRSIPLPTGVPKHKGSVRLRTYDFMGDTRVGIWLDFSNEDVQRLFLEENYLLQLLDGTYFKNVHVEIGQRRKKLVALPKSETKLTVAQSANKKFKLTDPEQLPWTKVGPFELYSCVGSFTQTGPRFNDTIASLIENIFTKQTMTTTAQKASMAANAPTKKYQKVLEFGSGVGTLTMILQKFAEQVWACEWDELALKGLAKTIEQAEVSENSLEYNLKSKIQLHLGDFHRPQKLLENQTFDLIVVNPARSGLKNFLQPVFASPSFQKKPSDLLYMSCFLPSFIEDLKNIMKDLSEQQNAFEYHLTEVHIVDQFPMSPHYEILAWLQVCSR
jgi:tRNA/tmRNA/rRNA uracil-C5-methylase (TrmA/RlmC/RlmD family)